MSVKRTQQSTRFLLQREDCWQHSHNLSYQAQLDVDPFKSSAHSACCVTIQLWNEHSTHNLHCTAIHLDGAELSQKVDCKVIKTFYWLIKWRKTWKSSLVVPADNTSKLNLFTQEWQLKKYSLLANQHAVPVDNILIERISTWDDQMISS